MRWMLVSAALAMLPLAMLPTLAVAQNFMIPSAQAEARHQDPTDPITPNRAPSQDLAQQSTSAPPARFVPDPGHADPTDYTAGQGRPSVGPNVP